MSLSDELLRLGDSARHLNAGSDTLNQSINRIDALLGRLNVGFEYVHARPLAETTETDPAGKRVINLAYLGYLKVGRGFHLAVRSTKVLESRLQLATESPGAVVPLLDAPRRLRFAAVDLLPELVAGLAHQVDEMVSAMERRQATADALLSNLERVTSDSSGRWARPDDLPGRAPVQALPPVVAPPEPVAPAPPVASAPAPARRMTMPPLSRVAAARTEFYPGTSTPDPKAGRKTMPIGSDTLRRVQKDEA